MSSPPLNLLWRTCGVINFWNSSQWLWSQRSSTLLFSFDSITSCSCKVSKYIMHLQEYLLHLPAFKTTLVSWIYQQHLQEYLLHLPTFKITLVSWIYQRHLQEDLLHLPTPKTTSVIMNVQQQLTIAKSQLMKYYNMMLLTLVFSKPQFVIQ